jgi:asparagine synthase (glutamine-hydrolysing)
MTASYESLSRNMATASRMPGDQLNNAARKLVERMALPRLAREVRSQKLTYLGDDKFISLSREIRRIRWKSIPGDFCELGVALGGSAIYIASRLGRKRRFHGFDVFGMIPPPSERDGNDSRARYDVIASHKSSGIGGDEYYGYVDNLYEKVVDNFSRFSMDVDGKRISLHKGLFEDTLKFGENDKIALAHIDCDWFDPVLFCVSKISPALSPGGVMIIDDYNYYEGCRKAIHHHLAMDKTLSLVRTMPHAILRKTGK